MYFNCRRQACVFQMSGTFQLNSFDWRHTDKGFLGCVSNVKEGYMPHDSWLKNMPYSYSCILCHIIWQIIILFVFYLFLEHATLNMEISITYLLPLWLWTMVTHSFFHFPIMPSSVLNVYLPRKYIFLNKSIWTGRSCWVYEIITLNLLLTLSISPTPHSPLVSQQWKYGFTVPPSIHTHLLSFTFSSLD